MPFEWPSFKEHCESRPQSHKYLWHIGEQPFGYDTRMSTLIEHDVKSALNGTPNWAITWLDLCGEELVKYSNIQEYIYDAMVDAAITIREGYESETEAENLMVHILTLYHDQTCTSD